MSTKGWSATVLVALSLALALPGCGESSPFSRDVLSIAFQTQGVPAADSGRLYNVVIIFSAEGGAALPDRFELTSGVLPTGVTLERDRADANLDGLPDTDGAFTGNARLLGVPRQRGSYSFTIKAISTGELGGPGGVPNPEQPDLAVSHTFAVNVGEGTIAILTPTAEEGTSDPAVPAFPAVVPFVNPANPDAFFSFPFLIAGGSNNNIATIYGPREWELSAFDASVDPSDPATLTQDVDESSVPGAPANLKKFEQNISDGGIFVIQAGEQKVQLGGFQSPRGPVRSDGPDAGEDITSADPPFMTSLLPDWFQDPGVTKSSRRDLADTLNLGGGDNTLGTALPVIFTDYFAAGYKSTTPPFEAKYPFTADQYLNAFFVPYIVGVDLTPLSYRLIVEAIDTRGTPTNKADDVIARKAYIVRVQIPDLSIDTGLLPAGRAGELYTAQIALSGGVPPLFADLEWVDGVKDLKATTTGSALTKDLFGVEVDPRTWQFIGAPRAEAPDTDPATTTPDGPVVELTVRAWAQVMNPTQSSPAQVPTGNAGEFDGGFDPDGAGPAPIKTGRHKTFQVNFEVRSAPVITNASLAAGIDGVAYPGDRIVATGGVPLLAPYPVGFFDASPGATYPSSTARRAYEFNSEYTQDTSPQNTPGAVVAGLPFNLTLIGNPNVATNGNISGTPFDRGFHPCRFMALDFYVGPATAPHATAFRTPFEKILTLSVSPDQALYLRGVQASEGTGGKANGLNQDDQMSEARMVPLLLAVGLFTVETGKTAVRFAGLPTNFDTLPVMMPHGGSDTHNRMSIPQVRGFWPAESNKEAQWYYYYGQGADQAWKHVQQEFTWLQSPDPRHTRVFMWAEATTVLAHNSSTWNQRFQQLDFTKRRGVLVLDPPTGKVHLAAVLDPTNDSDHGVLFGGEIVIGGRSSASTGNGTYYIEAGFYSKEYLYAVRDTAHDRQAHIHGGNNYLTTYSSSLASSAGYYMNSMGRTATSVAMSADGKWCATALVGVAPGGTNEQKIMLWRTDNTPIPAAILAQSFAEGVPWVDDTGTARAGTDSPRAVILKVGGESASGTIITENQRYLLPDSLMFVENGLLFLNETQLDRVFGVSLVDGHLSGIHINTARQSVNGGGFGPAVHATHGRYVPDNDYMVGCKPVQTVGTQFAFAGNKPALGTAGPKRVAFVAGDTGPTLTGGATGVVLACTDLSATTYPRQGYASAANSNKSLYFMDLNTTGGTGLELSTSILRDLTGSDPDVYGDMLSPGRFGEELDRLVLSDDGNYAAVVKDATIAGGYFGSTLYGYYGAFAGYYPYILTPQSSYDGWFPTQDLLVISTSGADMSAGGSVEHILFIGTGQQSASAKGGMPSYALQATHFNADGRRIHGLHFAPAPGPGSSVPHRLIINYAGGTYYNPASGYSFGQNWQPFNPSYTVYGVGDEISVSFAFRTAAGAATTFSSTSNFTNNLQGLTGTSSIGQTSAPIGETTSQQCFWATFLSENGSFLYYVSDQIDGSTGFTTANRNHMVGFNITGATIGTRDPYTPFSTHPNTVGFEQFDCNAWNYEGRFASSPAGAFFNGRDASGILCVIASDSSAGAGSATDLEVYAMDTNVGGTLRVLTSAVTSGSSNAINHLYLSADGNMLAGQVAKTGSTSASSRAVLNNNSDLFVVTNIHAVLGGATATAIIVSQAQSHGSTVAFVGDATGAGPQAILFSAGDPSSSNSAWANRKLKAAALAAGAVPTTLDNTSSHYAVLSGGRKLDDNATTSD